MKKKAAPKQTPVQELRALMEKNKLTNAEVAQFSGFSVKAVESWLANPKAASSRNFSQRNLNIIKIFLPTHLHVRELQEAKK